MECKIDKNMKICNCTFSCDKKGKCCDCIAYHRKLGELPACYFPADIERRGERTVEAYLRCRS
jgi:hypothetical protein